MATAPDSLVFTGQVLQQVFADNLLVTPAGGLQTTLGAALATATGGAVTATTLTASGAVTLSPANSNVLMQPTGTGTHAIDNMTIGVTTPLAIKSTTLTATGAVALSPASANVVLSPTGTGVVTINPATAGTINNASIGVTTPLAGKFTTASVTTDNGIVLTNQTSDSGAATATMTNGPTAGNPTFWLRISVNGTAVAVPAWTAV